MSVCLMWLLLFLSHQLFAEDILAPIEVKATKNVSAFSFSSSKKISLEEKKDATITTLLESVSGTMTVQDGGPGGRVSYFIRGTESRHVSFTLDGLKLNDPSNNDRQFDSSFFTSPFLAEIDVHKGPQAVLYGSDALGGQVEMKTRKGENAPDTRLEINGGSFGTIDSSLSSDWKNKNHHGTLTATRFHSDGLSRLNDKRFRARERDAADITQVTSSSAHHWNPKWSSELLASYLHGKNELDGGITENTKDHSVNDQYILQQKTNYELNEKSSFSLRNGLSRHQRAIRMLGQGLTQFEGDLYQHELLYQYDHSSDWHILSGLGNEREDLDLKTIKKESDLKSLFIQSFYKQEIIKYQLGLRSEQHSKYGRFDTSSAGIALYKNKSELGLQYSQGFKAPSLYQLYGPASFGFAVGNRDLVPEKNHGLELIGKTEYFEVSVFQNSLNDLIVYNVAQGFQNQGNFIVEGVELSSTIKGQDFQIAPSFTHQTFKDEETKILRRPQNSAQLQLIYFMTASFEISAKGKWMGSRLDLDPRVQDRFVKLSSYEILDLGCKYSFTKDEVGFQLLNVFDREYENSFGYSTTPLSLFAHYGHRF